MTCQLPKVQHWEKIPNAASISKRIQQRNNKNTCCISPGLSQKNIWTPSDVLLVFISKAFTPGVPVARHWACSCGPPGNGTSNQGVVYYDLWQARLWWLFGVGVSCFRKCVSTVLVQFQKNLDDLNMMDFNGFDGKGLKELLDTSAHVLARWDEMPRDEFGVPAHIPPELSTTIRHTCRGRCQCCWDFSPTKWM